MTTSVGRTITRLRLERGLTQERLAARMGVSPQAVSKWENDINYPDVASLPQLADALGTSVDALLRGVEPTTASASASQDRPPAGSPATGALVPTTAPTKDARSTSLGRQLRIQVTGSEIVDLAVPLALVTSLSGFLRSIPQLRTVTAERGLDLDSVLRAVTSAAESAGPATLVDIDDGNDHVRICID